MSALGKAVQDLAASMLAFVSKTNDRLDRLERAQRITARIVQRLDYQEPTASKWTQQFGEEPAQDAARQGEDAAGSGGLSSDHAKPDTVDPSCKAVAGGPEPVASAAEHLEEVEDTQRGLLGSDKTGKLACIALIEARDRAVRIEALRWVLKQHHPVRPCDAMIVVRAEIARLEGEE